MLDRLAELRAIAKPNKAPKQPAALKRYVQGTPYRELLAEWEELLKRTLAEHGQHLDESQSNAAKESK